MNARRAHFVNAAALGPLLAALALALAPSGAFAQSLGRLPPPRPGAQPAPATRAAEAAAQQATTYPTFDQVPALPTDVRSVAAWKAAVVDAKAAGAALTQEAAATPWQLTGDTQAFAAQATSEAQAPPAITSADDPGYAAALAMAARARAMSPSRAPSGARRP